MSVFRELINGKGNPNFTWEPTIFEGDFEANTVTYCNTYSDALLIKVNHPKRNNIIIELWYRKNPDLSIPIYVGDEKDMLNLQNELNKFA